LPVPSGWRQTAIVARVLPVVSTIYYSRRGLLQWSHLAIFKLLFELSKGGKDWADFQEMPPGYQPLFRFRVHTRGERAGEHVYYDMNAFEGTHRSCCSFETAMAFPLNLDSKEAGNFTIASTLSGLARRRFLLTGLCSLAG